MDDSAGVDLVERKRLFLRYRNGRLRRGALGRAVAGRRPLQAALKVTARAERGTSPMQSPMTSSFSVLSAWFRHTRNASASRCTACTAILQPPVFPAAAGSRLGPPPRSAVRTDQSWSGSRLLQPIGAADFRCWGRALLRYGSSVWTTRAAAPGFRAAFAARTGAGPGVWGAGRGGARRRRPLGPASRRGVAAGSGGRAGKASPGAHGAGCQRRGAAGR